MGQKSVKFHLLYYEIPQLSSQYCTISANMFVGNGKPWCSTMVDNSGKHVYGKGKWGWCHPDCLNGKYTKSISMVTIVEFHRKSSKTERILFLKYLFQYNK